MKPKKVNEIMKKLVKGWKNKIPKGTKLSYDFLKGIRDFLKLCPDEDGKKRVFDIETENTYLVPYEDIILNGLRQQDLKKYPKEGGL